MAGAMTYIFAHTIKKNLRVTYGDLLKAIHDQIEAAKKTRCLNLPILNRMFRYKFMQVHLIHILWIILNHLTSGTITWVW